MEKEENKPIFNGVFTDYFRKTLHDFREARGLTYQELALRLNCNWSTICKWEKGKSTKCSGILFFTLKSLFDGEYDHWIQLDEQEQKERMVGCLNEIFSKRLIHGKYRLVHNNSAVLRSMAVSRPDTLAFSGVLTSLHRQRLLWLQSTSRLTDELFSQVIGCTQITLRNWKKGRKTCCQTRFVIALRLLFRGDLDDKFIAMQ